MNLQQIFEQQKFTENGDVAYNTTGDKLLDILFMSEYYQKHLNDVKIGTSDKERLFSMFIRDPRFGLGRRDLGRRLMILSGVSADNAVKAGRFDDLFVGWEHMPDDVFKSLCNYLYDQIISGNELCKKWMPRYSSKNLMLARRIAKALNMNKQQYGHFIKCDTVENKLSRHRTEDIIFEHVPSLALLKYYKRFTNGEDTSGRFAQYLENVKSGKSKMNISTTTVYDIYKNRKQIDADLFFDQLEKISINALVIVDSSGSMQDSNDSFGKALSIGHYLTKCSSYMPGYFISFSSMPQLMQLQSGETYSFKRLNWGGRVTEYNNQPLHGKSKYEREINSMVTGDCTNTDFRAVCELLKSLDKENAPEWLVVLSDMEFDSGSSQSASEVQTMFKEFGFNTNIIWWNLNARNTTTTFQKDQFGNVYLSGYSPMLLKYLESGFDGTAFLNKLLDEYAKKVKVA